MMEGKKIASLQEDLLLSLLSWIAGLSGLGAGVL
jgi:hypothetical protein